MAKFTIKHACGHEHQYQIVGAIAERDRKAAWLASQDCPACRRAAEKANTLAAADASPFAAIAEAELVGSEKQTSWARDIRAKFLAAMNAEKIIPEEIFSATVECFAAKTDAKWWIDSRAWTVRDRLKAVMDEIKAIYFSKK